MMQIHKFAHHVQCSHFKFTLTPESSKWTVNKVLCHSCVLTCCCKLLTENKTKNVKNTIGWHIVCRAHCFASLHHNLVKVIQHCDNFMLKWGANMRCPTWSALITSYWYVIMLYLCTGRFALRHKIAKREQAQKSEFYLLKMILYRLLNFMCCFKMCTKC